MSKISLILFFLSSFLFGQIRLIELPKASHKNYFTESQTRNIYEFDSDWFVYKESSPGKRYPVALPTVFDGEQELVFEKTFQTPESLKDNILTLHFMGLSYQAEYFVNNISVFIHTGGEFPIEFDIPNSILNYDDKNTLKVKLTYFEDSEITIPLAQKFLFPKRLGGFLRDAYLEIKPAYAISDLEKEYVFESRDKLEKIKFSFSIKSVSETDSLLTKNAKADIDVKLFDNSGNLVTAEKQTITLGSNQYSVTLAGKKLALWNPGNKFSYTSDISLIINSSVVDEINFKVNPLNPYFTDSGFNLNGKKFQLNGVTYIPLEKPTQSRVEYYAKQIDQIKDAGFNAVRFNKVLPDPYLLSLCEEVGLLVLVDIPLDGAPEKLTENEEFRKRILVYVEQILHAYSSFDNVIGFGLGSSYINDSQAHAEFLDYLLKNIRLNPNKLFYASFIGIPQFQIDDLTAYGVQLFPTDIIKALDDISNSASISSGNLFVSEITYPTVYGKSNGYLNDYSFEAQAKFFNDLIKNARKTNLSGYFINSLYNFNGDYSSLFAGYSNDNVYKIGILANPDSPPTLTYKTIKAELKKDEKLNIPLGTKNDRSPIFFVIVALFLAIIMGILVNTKRKFREDATRALLRSYNFYADIRDHRILSGVHTFILMLTLAGAHSLLVTVILYYLRMNVLLEKLLIATNTHWIINSVSYLAWNPVNSLIILFFVTIFSFIVISLIIKGFTVFIQNRVLFSNIYFVVVWSFLPLLLLLPLELVLHKLLLLNSYNLILYGVLLFFFIWVIGRLFKGIYVIYDVIPTKVYLYGFLFLVVILGLGLVYFQLSNDTFYFWITAIKQHPLI